MKFYPHHIRDFDTATRHCTRLERSIYRDLMDLYYDTEEPLSLDMNRVCTKIIARSDEESTAVERVLNEFFTETPTGWYHSRCAEEITKYHANSSQKSVAGKASAASKALKVQQAINGCSTAVERTINGTSTNQEPRTNNQEPITKKDKKSVDAASQPNFVFVLPDWINRSHWDVWHRGSKRKKANDEQKQLSADKLAKWREQGLDHAAALENAASGDYQGLFLPPVKAGWQPTVVPITTPSRTGIDPALAKAISDTVNAKGPSDAVREQMRAMSGRKHG